MHCHRVFLNVLKYLLSAILIIISSGLIHLSMNTIYPEEETSALWFFFTFGEVILVISCLIITLMLIEIIRSYFEINKY